VSSINIPKFRAALFPSPSGQRCFSLLLPDNDKSVQLVAGLYALATDVANWQGDDVDCEAQALAFLNAYTEMNWEACLTSQWLLWNTRIFPTQLSAITGNDQIFTADAACDGAGYWIQSAAAINDALTWKVAIKAGSYQARITCVKSTGVGKVQLYIDGIPQIDFDTYSASAIRNFMEISGTFDVTADGIYEMTSLVYGKNASSSGYIFRLQYIDLIRISDL